MSGLAEKFLINLATQVPKKAYGYWREKREKESLEILQQELLGLNKTGKFPTSHLEQDEFFRALLRFERAVKEGAANKNLRLMAQIIKGTVLAGDMNSDRCIYLQSIIAEMAPEEIVLATKLYLNSKVGYAYNITKHAMVPSVYPDIISFEAAFARLMRTGLVVPQNTGQPLGGKSQIDYIPTPLLNELSQLCELQIFNNISN